MDCDYVYITDENRISRKTLVSLLVAVLVSSLFVGIFMNGANVASLENVIHVKNENELKNAINNASNGKSTTIALDKDITLTNTLVIPKNKDITLASNKASDCYKLIGADYKSTIIVENGGVLRLDGIVVIHVKNAGKAGGGVYVEANGKLILYSGEILGNTVVGGGSLYDRGSGGGGVYNLGVFEMYGGKIAKNSATGLDDEGSGGGVVNGGTFVMSGGEISDNNANVAGGGVHNAGVFTMSGGKITNNRAGYWGGGVSNFGTFERLGGVISDNTAGVSGDNVHPNDGGNGGGSSNGSGSGDGSSNDGGSNENDDGSSSGGDGGTFMDTGFSLRDVVFVCVGVAIVVVGVVVAVLLFTYKKVLEFAKGKSEVKSFV